MRPRPLSSVFDDFRLFLVVVVIGKIKTQEESRMLLAGAHNEAAGEGRSSPFVVHPDFKTSGEILDKARKVWKRLQVVKVFVHGWFFFTIVETNLVSAMNGVDNKYTKLGENRGHDAGIVRIFCFNIKNCEEWIGISPNN